MLTEQEAASYVASDPTAGRIQHPEPGVVRPRVDEGPMAVGPDRTHETLAGGSGGHARALDGRPWNSVSAPAAVSTAVVGSTANVREPPVSSETVPGGSPLKLETTLAVERRLHALARLQVRHADRAEDDALGTYGAARAASAPRRRRTSMRGWGEGSSADEVTTVEHQPFAPTSKRDCGRLASERG